MLHIYTSSSCNRHANKGSTSGEGRAQGLKTKKIGSLALDVYEEETKLFFEDRSDDIIEDDVFARLLTFPNVLITAHQAFLTREALGAIAETTLNNISDVIAKRMCSNRVVPIKQ